VRDEKQGPIDSIRTVEKGREGMGTGVAEKSKKRGRKEGTLEDWATAKRGGKVPAYPRKDVAARGGKGARNWGAHLVLKEASLEENLVIFAICWTRRRKPRAQSKGRKKELGPYHRGEHERSLPTGVTESIVGGGKETRAFGRSSKFLWR